jgi:hypothetical protein
VSYNLEFAYEPKQKGKKHALDLYPYSAELILFEPLDGADNCYGLLYKPIGPSSYKEAGEKGLALPQLLLAAAHFTMTGDFRDFHFSTLLELNNEFDPFPWQDDTKQCHAHGNNLYGYGG